MPREKITRAECVKCGVCCLPPVDGQKAFCNVTPEDAEILGKKLTRRLCLFPSVFDYLVSVIDRNGLPWAAIKTKDLKIQGGPFKGLTTTACQALTGSPMHKVRCTIYKIRPQVCHQAVKQGDTTCRKLRKHFQKMADET
jgi:Fe-S-cluster containining protein